RVASAAVAANSITVFRMSADSDADEKICEVVVWNNRKSNTLSSPKDAPAYQLAHAETPQIAAIAMVAGMAHVRLKLKARMLSSTMVNRMTAFQAGNWNSGRTSKRTS